MEKDKINEAIGELLIKEKYRFFPNGLIGEVVRDFVKEYDKNAVHAQENKK